MLTGRLPPGAMTMPCQRGTTTMWRIMEVDPSRVQEMGRSSTASHEYRWKESIMASIALAIFVVIAFGYGLKLQLPILPPMFTR